jgi:hypothetical protein
MFKKLLGLLPSALITPIINDSFSVLKERGEIKTWIVQLGDKYPVEFGLKYKVRSLRISDNNFEWGVFDGSRKVASGFTSDRDTGFKLARQKVNELEGIE